MIRHNAQAVYAVIYSQLGFGLHNKRENIFLFVIMYFFNRVMEMFIVICIFIDNVYIQVCVRSVLFLWEIFDAVVGRL